jgi:hypothetical protein
MEIKVIVEKQARSPAFKYLNVFTPTQMDILQEAYYCNTAKISEVS